MTTTKYSNIEMFLCDNYRGFKWRKSRNSETIEYNCNRKTLYDDYVNYCEMNKYTPVSKNELHGYLMNNGIVCVAKSHGVLVFKFIRDKFMEYINEIEKKLI